MEEYLAATWSQRRDTYGKALVPPEPRGDAAIAKMRLSLQAQTADKQEAVLVAFDQLQQADQRLLSEEMARTGIGGQRFDRGPEFGEIVAGPTFLVYYSPAFLRNLAPLDALPALRILTEVYRRARQLWPLRPSTDAHHSVTIRIDQIKELKLSSIMEAFAEGESWLLVRQNDQEGVVERHRLTDMAKVMQDGTSVVLKLWRADRGPGGSNSFSNKTGRKRKVSRAKVGFRTVFASEVIQQVGRYSISDGASSSAATTDSHYSLKSPPLHFGSEDGGSMARRSPALSQSSGQSSGQSGCTGSSLSHASASSPGMHAPSACFTGSIGGDASARPPAARAESPSDETDSISIEISDESPNGLGRVVTASAESNANSI